MRWWDIDAVLAMERELFAGDPPWSAEQFWSELAAPGRTYVVAVGPGQRVVGYAGLAAGVDTADVQTIGVDPRWQRRGVGAALLDALLAAAARAGVPDVLLEVRPGNAAALRLYGSRGFERLARRRRYYDDGQDGLVLRRRLRPGTVLAGSRQ